MASRRSPKRSSLSAGGGPADGNVQEPTLAAATKSPAKKETGFRLFELYLRGREELICRIYHPLSLAAKHAKTGARAAGKGGSSARVSYSASQLQLSKRQRQSIFQEDAVMFVPASPCDREIEKDTNHIAFLIAGYARYKHPYVWLRSNHAVMANIPRDATSKDAESPVFLETIQAWSQKETHLWDILNEVLRMVHRDKPADFNPFAVDHAYFTELALDNAAMLDFLIRVYGHQPPYAHKVWEDIQQLKSRHLLEINTLMKN